MLKQTARFACLALLMFAASATPLTAHTASIQFDGPDPYPLPPPMCLPGPCQVGLAR